ncbi:MAG: class I SAM-dependent methyltransferase [Candidatus Heimdallarchaeota archaeon]|nr:class I SAM-dependent methyltransferase [Candidatus Heimdallarchaeota archaeon]
MNNNQENLKVAAPEKWMNGWDNVFKKLLEESDEYLRELQGIYHPIQNLARSIYGKCDGFKALDLGSGDGTTTLFLAKIGCKVDSIDALASSINLINKRAEIMGFSENISTEIKDIDGWTVEPESYDIIIATQCLQYLFDRAIPRLEELAAGIKPGGFLVYSGNIEPHFKLEPPMRFILKEELMEIFDGWIFHNIGNDERLLRPNDLRGYVWCVVQKPDSDK